MDAADDDGVRLERQNLVHRHDDVGRNILHGAEVLEIRVTPPDRPGAEAMRLAANVIGASDLPTAIAAKVLATSEGNPLFVGELVRMLVQEGAITREGDRWIAGTRRHHRHLRTGRSASCAAPAARGQL